jgi:hypothetical protein
VHSGGPPVVAASSAAAASEAMVVGWREMHPASAPQQMASLKSIGYYLHLLAVKERELGKVSENRPILFFISKHQMQTIQAIIQTCINMFSNI